MMSQEPLEDSNWLIGRGTLIAALSVAVGLSVLDVEFALAAESGGPITRQALAHRQEDCSRWGRISHEPMFGHWDRTNGMSKKEWKATCKRAVKKNPALYGKPF